MYLRGQQAARMAPTGLREEDAVYIEGGACSTRSADGPEGAREECRVLRWGGRRAVPAAACSSSAHVQ